MPSPLAKRLERFVALNDDDYSMLGEATQRTRTFKSNTHIFAEGAHSSDVYILVDGFACEYRMLRDGSRQLIRLLMPGDILNQNVSILSEQRSNFIAQSGCKVCSIPPKGIEQIMQVSHLAQAWLQADQLDHEMLIETVVRIGRRPAFPRVAHFICETYSRLMLRNLARNGHFPLPMTQQDLSDLLGMSTVHINRSLRELVNQKLIVYSHRLTTILDGSRLQRIADYSDAYLFPRSEMTRQNAPASNIINTVYRESATVQLSS